MSMIGEINSMCGVGFCEWKVSMNGQIQSFGKVKIIYGFSVIYFWGEEKVYFTENVILIFFFEYLPF